MMKTNRNNQKGWVPPIFKKGEGFTLVELLISMLLFGLMLGLIFGLISNSLRGGEQEQIRDALLGELTYAGEYMGRHARSAQREGFPLICGASSTGKTYTVVGGNHLYFKNEEDVCQEFYVQPQAGVMRLVNEVDGTNSFLTSPAIDIEEIAFVVQNESNADDGQPLLTMYIKAAGVGREHISVEFQTSVSSRGLDD